MVNYVDHFINDDAEIINAQTDNQSESPSLQSDTTDNPSDADNDANNDNSQSYATDFQPVTATINGQAVCKPNLRHKIITNIIGLEGDYVNHPDDGGGKTRFGITEAKAREYGYKGDINDLPYEKAYKILSVDFYDTLRIDYIAKISETIAKEIVDTAVNTGQKPAVQFLQKALNALNNRSKHYPDISVDGIIGRKTLETLQKYFDQRKNKDGDQVLLLLLNMFQTIHYWNESTETIDDKHESFLYGWLRNRVLKKFKIIS
jgi:hypothetical protein